MNAATATPRDATRGGRPRLVAGEHSDFSYRWRGEVCVAYCRCGDTDDMTRRIEASGKSKVAAKRALQQKLAGRVPAGRKGLTPDSTFAAAADVYMDWVRRNKTPGTAGRYESNLRAVILPELGTQRLRNCTVARLGDFMDDLAEDYAPATRRGIKAVVRGVLQTGVRRGALPANPADQLDRIEGRPRRTVAYTPEVLLDFMQRFDANTRAHAADLPDLIRVLFGVGLRIGEALALRWQDINLTAQPTPPADRAAAALADPEVTEIPPHALWVNGNIVHVTGAGLVRNAGKTFSSNRVLAMPQFLVATLMFRRPADAADSDAVFPPPEGRLPWRYASNVRRSLRAICVEIGYPDFHPHVGRSTTATFLKNAGMNDLDLADYLGHAQIRTTQDHYFARGRFHPEAAAHMDAAHRTPG